jgi:hypothetical protein
MQEERPFTPPPNVVLKLTKTSLRSASAAEACYVGRTLRMSALHWYYCDVERASETAHGPGALEKLAAMIRAGDLPFDVLVSTERSDAAQWVEADTVREILDAIPLDRERLIQEYIAYGEAPRGQENWGWASARMYALLEGVPELAWALIVEMIERAPSDASLGFLAASPLEDLLSENGIDFIDRVEQRARESRPFHRALGMLRRLGMTDDVWRRVQSSAKSLPSFTDGSESPQS